jgi:hypothetical protein
MQASHVLGIFLPPMVTFWCQAPADPHGVDDKVVCQAAAMA